MADEEEASPPVDDNGDDGEESSEDTPEDEYKPPSKEEWLKAREAARKAREDRDKARLAAKEAREERDRARGEKQTDEERVAAQKAEQEKWQRTAVTNAAVGELVSAGYTKAQARRLSKLIDLSNVEIDDDGDIDLDEEIEQLAKDFPPDKGVTRGGARVTTGRGREDSQPKDDVDTRFAKKLLGLR